MIAMCRRPGIAALAVTIWLATISITHAHDSLPARIAQITRQIAADSGNAALYLERGALYRVARRWDAALGDLDRAAELDSGLIEVERVRAVVLLALARHRDAEAASTRYLAHTPHDHETLTVRARARVALAQYREAAADFTVALATRPLPDLYIERARAERARGVAGRAAARRGLEEGLARLGSVVTLELEALELELASRAYDEALVRVDRLAAGAPRKESWLRRRGDILQRAGRRAEAANSYRAALAAAASLPAWTQQAPATRALIADLQRRLARLESGRRTGSTPSRTQP
jgi:tetratricopeptide (TPR) repeat protein